MANKYPSMTDEEKKEWYELDDYVRHSVMGFVDEGLTTKMVLRLKGLRYGQVMANNSHDKRSNYSFKTILLTFKACAPQIQRVIATKTFKNNMQKFNYIMAIVENQISDVSIRRAEEERRRSEQIDHSISTDSNLDMIYEKKNQVAKSTQKKEKKNKFSNLW